MSRTIFALVVLVSLASAQDVMFQVPMQVGGQNRAINVRAGDDAYALARTFCAQNNVGAENVELVVKEILKQLEVYNQKLQQQRAQAAAQQQAAQQAAAQQAAAQQAQQAKVAQLQPKGASMFQMNVGVDAQGTQKPLVVRIYLPFLRRMTDAVFIIRYMKVTLWISLLSVSVTIMALTTSTWTSFARELRMNTPPTGEWAFLSLSIIDNLMTCVL